ncbi:MAG: transcription termination/antitermination protein NusG [Planctomycetota bacterium]|nr:transcription termination/antitermination protein NusG [Planctomycetota bacterium]
MAKKWYIVKVENGREEAIRDALKKRVEVERLGDVVGRVLVATEKVSEIRGGKKRVMERKMYPGYVMLEIEVGETSEIPERAWFLILETPGVQGFVGLPYDRKRPGPRKPPAMQDYEVQKVLHAMEEKEEAPKINIRFAVGDTVRIKEGPFENIDGSVEEINEQKGMVKVVVNIFGRATPVELGYWQVEPL